MLTLVIALTEKEAIAIARLADRDHYPSHDAVGHEAIRRLLRDEALQTPRGRPLGFSPKRRQKRKA